LPANDVPRARRFDPASHIRFETLSVEQGLSQSTVRAILQDREGLIWFGTEDGLNRYDGYTFETFKHDPANPASLASNAITALSEDASGALWVGTENNGLTRWDRARNQFAHFHKDAGDAARLNHNNVRALCEDQAGTLWIATVGGLHAFDQRVRQLINFREDASFPKILQDGIIYAILETRAGILWFGTNDGLIRFDRATRAFTHYRHDPNDATTLSANAIIALAQDARGAVWAGTNTGGVNILNADERTFTRLQSNRDDPNSLSSNGISVLRADGAGTMWAGTWDQGVNRYDPVREKFIRYAREQDNPTSLGNNGVRAIFEDRSGMMWIGTFGGGVSKFNRASEQFAHYRAKPGAPNSLSGNLVFALFAEPNGVLWIGTEQGLNRLDRSTAQVTTHKNDPQNLNTLAHDIVRVVYQDRAGALWIGTEGGGLNHFDPSRNLFVRYVRDPNNPASIGSNVVAAMYEDASGALWLATSFGLDRFDRATNRFTHYRNKPDDPTTLSHNTVVALYPDRSGALWLATFGGLNKFDPNTNQVTRYVHDPRNPNSLSQDMVLNVYQDRAGMIWIGTYTGGLNKLDPATGRFTHYREKQGLPNDTVYAILEDDAGYLWLSTNKGIAKFDPRAETFKQYDAGDGLQSNEFNWGAFFKSASGEMFFGGINGVTAFYPWEIQDNTFVPPVVVTQLMQGGQPRARADTIELTWPQNYFEFEFAALNFAQAQKNQYAYRLDPFDRDWNYIGAKRAGRYTNLPGGAYTLRLKASNDDGVWNEHGATLAIRVIPPVWETGWFRVLLALAFTFAGFVLYRLRVRGIRARNRELEKIVDERTWALGQQKRELETRTDQLERQQNELQALYQADEELHHHLHLDDVLQALTNLAVDSLHADKSAVLTWDPARECLAMRVARGYAASSIAALHFARGEPIAGRVLATGEPIIVEDTRTQSRGQRAAIAQIVRAENIHSLMHLPIKIGAEVFGVFNVSYTRAHAFGENEQRLFTALAQRAALAIEGARHFDAEQRRADQFQIIAAIGRDTSALLDTHQILDQVTRALRETFGYYHVAIGLIEGDEVVYRTGAGVLWDDPRFDFKPGRLKIGHEGITGWVAANGKALCVPDVSREPRYVWMQGSATRSELTVPLIIKDQVIGVLDAQSDRLNAFDHTDVAVLESIAHQTAAAIENARLYERAQELAVLQERHRLARDLHDAVTQTLFSASLLADALPAAWDQDPNEARQLSKELRQLSRGALAEMRTLLLELRPAALVETKLGDLLKQLSEAAAGRAGLIVTLNVAGDCKLPAEAHIALYRIAQEALNNIVKHARATRVLIELDGADDHARLVVRDDGRGFDLNHIPVARFGISNLRERAQAIGAELSIASAPGQGTQILVKWTRTDSRADEHG
jgi:ligand-binding sensor domain-containing protein/signal transduction histidine kinase